MSENIQTTTPEKSNRWIWWVAAVVVLCLILTCCVVSIGGVYLYSTGQISLPFLSKLDYQAVPLNGQVSLESGFVPDPFTASISTGGSIDTSKLNLADGCVGFTSKEPTFNVNWSGMSSNLRIFYIADSGHAALVIRDPNGKWSCNNNYSTGALADFPNSVEGQYSIWVTASAKDTTGTGTLYVTEMGYAPDNLPNAGGGSNALDPNASPNDGELDLTAGFTPDPNSLQITSGGIVDVTSLNLGNGCAGYVTSQPDLLLHWSGGASAGFLRIFFVTDDASDTTLIVNTPGGDWLCNDDSSYGLDPVVDIDYTDPGSYHIWVGTSNPDILSVGTLYFTQSDYNPSNFTNSSGSDTLDYTLTSTYGSTNIGDNSTPDPYSIDIIAGGSVDVSSLALGPDCTGFAANAPDFRFDYIGSTSRLRVFFVAADGSDTTLIVNAADETWVCNNDDPVSGTTNPMIEFSNPQTGTYDVWVGTYGSSNFTSGTLYITELDYTPSHLP